MGHTNKPKPESVLHLSELDIDLVQALTKHWLVIVEQQNGIVISLYAKE